MNYLPKRAYCVLASAWRRRYVIAIPILILPIIGAVIASTSAKRYASHTSLLIQETAKMNPFLEDLAVSAMLKERIAALTTLLHSRHILTQVALEIGAITETSSDFEKDAAIAKLSSNLHIIEVGKDLIRIDLSSDRPEGMQQTLNSVLEHFIDQLLAPERSSITDSAEFLDEHLQKRQVELHGAETALAEFKLMHAEALPDLHTMNIARLNSLKQDLATKEAELAGAQKNVGGLHQLLVSSDPIIGRIEEQIVTARGELALLRARYTDSHSKVQATLRTISRLEEERTRSLSRSERSLNAEQLWDIASTIKTAANEEQQPLLISQLRDLQNAKNQAERLAEEIEQRRRGIDNLQTKLNDFGRHESELLRLERDLKVKRELYENLLERRELAEVMGSLGRFEQGKRIKIIDRPFTPSAPINLPLALHVIAGFVAAIVLGTGLAILLEITDTSVRYRDQLEKLTRVKVICRIPMQSQLWV